MSQNDSQQTTKVDASASADCSLESPPFRRDDCVCRIGFDGIWHVTEAVYLRGTWWVGVAGQWRGWPFWPAEEFVLVNTQEVTVSISA